LKLFHSGRYAVAAALVLAIGVPSVAVGYGEGHDLVLGKRNPSSNPSHTLTRETEIIANTDGYATRQSNRRDGNGGGAIYGCRSNAGTKPCLRASNLKGGHAFEFATVGNEAGTITTKDASGAPFTTNATGVATGLNADRVDGKNASDFAAASDLGFASVTDAGALSAGRGATSASRSGSAPTFNYAVVFDHDVSKCSFTATAIGAPAALGVTPPTASALGTVTVTAATATSFHLQVIC
jgi:hypothetical protein